MPPLAEPEQLAAAITWLASDDAANVTGIVLASDGGWSALQPLPGIIAAARRE